MGRRRWDTIHSSPIHTTLRLQVLPLLFQFYELCHTSDRFVADLSALAYV